MTEDESLDLLKAHATKLAAKAGREVDLTVLFIGREQYAFVYTDKNRGEVLNQFGRFASNPELSFSWYSAAVGSQKVRQEAAR